MLFLGGVYITGYNGVRFRCLKAPTSAELTALTQQMALRTGCFLERQGLLERDSENSDLASDHSDEDPMDQLRGAFHYLSHRVGTSARAQGIPLQTLPGTEEPFGRDTGQAAGFSLHAGVSARADQREKVRAGTAREAALGQKLERLCRYITRSAVSEKRLSLMNQGQVRYELKTHYQDGTTHVIFEPVEVQSRSFNWYTVSYMVGDGPGHYLSRGKPVVLQDAGFSRHLPCGRGLIVVNDVVEAAEAIAAINADYRQHAEWARELEEEELSADMVVGAFLSETGF